MDRNLSKEEQIGVLAAESIRMAQDCIVMKLRYLDAAVYALNPVCKQDALGISTDGECFYYEPRSIVRRCRNGLSKLTHDYLHTLMHCIFQHNHVSNDIDSEIWNIATDMAVEEVIYQMCKDQYPEWHGERQLKELTQMSAKVGELTAERIYENLMKDMPRKLTREQLHMFFHVDEHVDWYKKDDALPFFGQEKDSSGSIRQEEDGGTPIDENSESEDGTDWERIADTIRMSADMGAFNNDESYLSNSLRNMEEKIASYSEFLRHFAARKELVKVDDSSFDYIFYTYGMELYGDMPLVEPLELKEDKRVEDLVIVIDSSASTSGEIVESFVRETFEILQDDEILGRSFSIRIIQCDNEIQEDVVLRNRREAELYLKGMRIKGQGGTDFRPAFSYIEELTRRGAFSRLKGIVYFTDGKGIFPERKPRCETAFVFTDKQTALNTEIPFWAIKTVLGDHDEY